MKWGVSSYKIAGSCVRPWFIYRRNNHRGWDQYQYQDRCGRWSGIVKDTFAYPEEDLYYLYE